ncbi:hypothetical protein ACIBEK_27845 [Nocardia fusca]|uniref:hypothetical protein n=1 Tax=Nocardia fusca TaxID=941183 RepID=UPI0037946F3C
MPADETPEKDSLAVEPECRSQAPIRGNAHAHRLLALHAGHSCRRYFDALHHTTEVRT